MNKSSNELWANADNYEDWETSRPLLFRDDMRDTFFKWFRVKPDHKVLDGGCATGVLTYLISNIDHNDSWSWSASMHYIVSGTKPE